MGNGSFPGVKCGRGCNNVFPRDIVCLRNISTNTLYKGDDDDDDVNNNNNNNNNYNR